LALAVRACREKEARLMKTVQKFCFFQAIEKGANYIDAAMSYYMGISETFLPLIH